MMYLHKSEKIKPTIKLMFLSNIRINSETTLNPQKIKS